MKMARFFCSVVLAMSASTAFAQTCASPILLSTAPLVVTGTTCAGTTQLASLANGSMRGGQQIVHKFTLGPGNSTSGFQLTLQPEAGVDMALFVCSNACSPTATCVAAVDNAGTGGSETAALPTNPGDYYVIVQASSGAAPSCGGYSLVVSGPL